MFFGFFLFMFCKFLKALCARIVFYDALWESDFPNLFLQKFVLLTGTLCQLSNLLKANKKFSTSLFVPFQFKWKPLLLQSYFGLIIELLIKQIFLLRHSFLRCQFTSIALALCLSLRGTIPETNTLLLSDLHNKATSIRLMVKPQTSNIRMTYDYIRVTYGWHTSTYEWHTSDIRMTCEYIRVTYGWHTSTYEWHTDDIRVHTSDIRMIYEYIRMTYEYIRVAYEWHTSDIRMTCGSKEN